ncbi:MAG: sodium:solute symporter family protein [Melioribacteraceae bacterium]|nr:Na+:solute symporter [Melioribacteraceae bacterium]WKZ69275.1 MAG: sodium:solute symporter family protein [Melioribacteraceae bacterium]
MLLQTIDWIAIVAFMLLALLIGIWSTKRAGKNSSEYFLSGRNMPWYVLGVSMVATTFSIDTPNLVSDITRQNGIAGNWVWWAFLLTGMLTVFVYAKLWRRSDVMTDVEFYEIRYSGKPAAFLRGFRALYLGMFFNIVIMASVTLAAIKVGNVMLNLTPLEVILIAGGVTVIYSSLGGLLGVLITDFILFILAMFGSITAAYVAVSLPEIGSLSNLLSHPNVIGKLDLIPDFNNWELALTVFIIPIAVQWWSVWYPGSEPGGGGYIAQRMLAAKNEKHAVGATLFFNFAHYALRPWPWIIVALASLIVFPELSMIKEALPHIDDSIIKHDMAYPAMLTLLPSGLLGLVIASLIAAYMSTMSTSLNWGSSYVVNDFYRRFLKPQASEKELVFVGRISTIVMMIIASSFALFLESALNAFNVLLQIGAGTGLLFILRWFWWRINAYSELTAMVVSFLIALFFLFLGNYHNEQINLLVENGIDRETAAMQIGALKSYQELVIGVIITTFSWIIVTLITKPADESKLLSFYKLVRPGGIGWKKVIEKAESNGEIFSTDETKSHLPLGILAMFLGVIAVYGLLMSIGYWLYSQYLIAIILTIVVIICSVIILKLWPKLND